VGETLATLPTRQTGGAGALALAPAGVAVTGIGLHCPAGDQAVGLFGAVATGLSLSRADECLSAPLPGGDGEAAMVVARSATLEGIDPDERMFEALARALEGALAQLSNPDGGVRRIAVRVLVPDTDSGRARGVSHWEARLRARGLLPEGVAMHFQPADGGATRHFIQALEAWDEAGWDTLVLGAVDSLVDELTCRTLARAGRAQTVRSDGVVPGEAACCLLLERNPAHDGVLAWIDALAVAEEPHAGAAHSRRLEGLGRAMRAALGSAGRALDDLGALALSLGSDTAAMLEWYQTETRLWPTELPEADRVAVAIGETDAVPAPAPCMPERLDAGVSLGDIGVAALPVALALACARFDFEHPAVEHCMAVEGGAQPERGAVLLRRPGRAGRGTEAA
jgi:3-oxoacyl-[acyl-carrier-protein] synthase I